jgi:hypothetical protein
MAIKCRIDVRKLSGRRYQWQCNTLPFAPIQEMDVHVAANMVSSSRTLNRETHRLQHEKISEGAKKKAVHGESGGKGGEFGREGVHVCLLKPVIVILRWRNLERDRAGAHAIFGE